MTIKELRIIKNLTQKEVANELGMSIRSYKQYENEPSKVGTIKYQYIQDYLNKVGYIDEEHGILTIEQIKVIVSPIFEKYNVDFCYLFGSYAKNEMSEKSDIDLLVCTLTTGMHFYGLCETLRENLGKKIDLLNTEQLVNNKHLIDEILKTGIKIYEKN